MDDQMFGGDMDEDDEEEEEQVITNILMCGALPPTLEANKMASWSVYS